VSPQRSSSKTAGPFRKPRADLYTALLAIALVALLLGILCLYLEMKQYDFKFKGGPPAPTFKGGPPAPTVPPPPQAAAPVQPPAMASDAQGAVLAFDAHPARAIGGRSVLPAHEATTRPCGLSGPARIRLLTAGQT